jgi:1-acyl-sn-glycerol-3-phosphate acyltransferase
MRFVRTLHTYYGLLVFALLFLVFFWLLLIPILLPRQHKLIGVVNRWWAKLLFIFVFLPYRIEYRAKLDPKKVYIFCANHFSYLDIPAMGLVPVNTVFVGKNDMEKVPFFGFMYRKLHITVNRESMRSRGATVKRSMEAIEEGKSLIIFPEGGMITKHAPHMVPFKDGAFRTAIEKQIPIVPVTLPFNWLILPDQNPMRLASGKIEVIFHRPIETVGMDLTHVGELKQKVFSVIDHELKKKNNTKIG